MGEGTGSHVEVTETCDYLVQMVEWHVDVVFRDARKPTTSHLHM